MSDEPSKEKKEQKERVSSGCEAPQKAINGVFMISLIIIGAMSIMFALSLLFTAGAYNNFVWDFTTYPTWQFIISIVLGIGALLMGLWLIMKKRCA